MSEDVKELMTDSGVAENVSFEHSLDDGDYPMGSEPESYCSGDFEEITKEDIENAMVGNADGEATDVEG